MQGNASATNTCIAVSVLLVHCRCLFLIGMEGNFDDSRIARDRYGRPLKDRYGRPIYRRVDGASPKHARPREADSRGASRRPIPPRPDRNQNVGRRH